MVKKVIMFILAIICLVWIGLGLYGKFLSDKTNINNNNDNLNNESNNEQNNMLSNKCEKRKYIVLTNEDIDNTKYLNYKNSITEETENNFLISIDDNKKRIKVFHKVYACNENNSECGNKLLGPYYSNEIEEIDYLKLEKDSLEEVKIYIITKDKIIYMFNFKNYGENGNYDTTLTKLDYENVLDIASFDYDEYNVILLKYENGKIIDIYGNDFEKVYNNRSLHFANISMYNENSYPNKIINEKCYYEVEVLKDKEGNSIYADDIFTVYMNETDKVYVILSDDNLYYGNINDFNLKLYEGKVKSYYVKDNKLVVNFDNNIKSFNVYEYAVSADTIKD